MKKLLLVLPLIFSLTFLAACSNNTAPVSEKKTEEKATSDETATKAEEEKATEEEVAAVETRKVFVEPEWVKSVIDGKQKESENFLVMNVAWGEVADNQAYTDGHIPGAVHLNTDYIEEEKIWNYRTPEEFKELFKKYGITKDTTVILYSTDANNSADDRAALGFLWAGVDNVKVLNGGFAKWVEKGYETEKGEVKPSSTDKDFGVEIPQRKNLVLTIDQVKEALKNDENFKLVSIRSKAEFDGETSGYGYIDRAGEPKGAIWGHDTDDGSYSTADGKQADLGVFEGYLKEAGASLDNNIAVYCGTGWRASIPVLIAYENGKDNVVFYDGGWFQWQMDPANEVQVGDPASDKVEYTTVDKLPTDKAKK